MVNNNNNLQQISNLMDQKFKNFGDVMDKKFSGMEQKFDKKLDTKLSEVEQKFAGKLQVTEQRLNKRIKATEQRLNKKIAQTSTDIGEFMEKSLFPMLDEKADKSDIDRIENKLDRVIDITAGHERRIKDLGQGVAVYP